MALAGKGSQASFLLDLLGHNHVPASCRFQQLPTFLGLWPPFPAFKAANLTLRLPLLSHFCLTPVWKCSLILRICVIR